MGTGGRLVVVASGAAEAQEKSTRVAQGLAGTEPRPWTPPVGRSDCPGDTACALHRSTELPSLKSRAGGFLCVPAATQEDPVGDISEPPEVEAVLRDRRGSNDHPGLWPRPLLVFLFP